MSNTIEALLDNAYQDSVLLSGNDDKGDVFSIPREVEFVLYAPDPEKAELVASFINDNSYGDASADSSDGRARILVKIYMPVTQNVLNSVSGLMVCVSKLFGIEYDGWGCVLQRDK